MKNLFFITISVYLLFFSTDIAAQKGDIHLILKSSYGKSDTEVLSALKELKGFPLERFDDQTREYVDKIIKSIPPHLDQWLKLAGFLQMEEELLAYAKSENDTEISDILASSKDLKNVYNLALVRSGNSAKLETLMKNVEKLKLDDNFVYEALPQLIYARQKPVLDYLLEQIMDKSQNCTPADAETGGKISCAYRIIEAVAPYIEDFPFEVDEYGIETDDYPQMLKDMRRWIEDNKSSYEVIMERY